MNGREVALQQVKSSDLQAVRRMEAEVGFSLRVLGQSDAPVIPQQAGSWWLEPVTARTELPQRAQRRLRAFLASGINVRAVVLFHELPAEGQPVRPFGGLPALGAALDRVLAGALAPLFREGPQHHSRAAGILRTGGTALLRTALQRGRDEAGQLVAALTEAQVDPCLVVVTADGTWIEIDRWFD